MKTLRLTAAQALVRYIQAQYVEYEGQEVPFCAGVWAIFGHGNVAGLGEALYQVRESLPTLRAHNEQGMANAAIAYTKALGRRRIMACTTSVGPGATNMVTSAALAHVNRLPLLLLPGDTFASRMPDPVLQQLETFSDPTMSVNDCFRPVSRYWDRISRPEQLLVSLPRAFEVLLDPVDCGPVTLCLPQDVQAEAWDYPESFFARRVHRQRRPQADQYELEQAVQALRTARKPLLVAGGGVHYSGACETLAQFARDHGIPVAETQAGKGALNWQHPQLLGGIGVTGSDAANELAAEADVVLAVGTRLADFTTGSRSLFGNPALKLVSLNVGSFDGHKHAAQPLICDAQVGLVALSRGLAGWQAADEWQALANKQITRWNRLVDQVTARVETPLPNDAQVLGCVNRAAGEQGVVVCAAGGLPGELQKLWRTERPGGYHLEYGFSCMGYEVAGGLGVKMARPERDVFVMVGDGSYLMLNSELATSVMLGHKITVVLLDNRGFACINRLQQACGGAPFNNLLQDSLQGPDGAPDIDFAAHAAALGAASRKVASLEELEQGLDWAAQQTRSCVLVIDTDPMPKTQAGGFWWDVPVPESSERLQVQQAYQDYREQKRQQRI